MRRKFLADNPTNGEIRKYFADGSLERVFTLKYNKLDGEKIVYCDDGSVKEQGNFDYGRGIGTHQYRDNCMDSIRKVATYDSPGDVVDESRFIDGELMEHTYRDPTFAGGNKDFVEEYKRSETTKAIYLYSRDIR